MLAAIAVHCVLGLCLIMITRMQCNEMKCVNVFYELLKCTKAQCIILKFAKVHESIVGLNCFCKIYIPVRWFVLKR
jgi:hypothetical protein